MNRFSPSELAFQAYRLLMIVLTFTVVIRVFCEYDWATSALYSVSTVCSFFVGQGIVTVIQNRQRTDRKPLPQENERY